MDGVRLNPRKADLQQWRERFAARLQDRGVNAVATRASTPGMAKAPKQLWRVRAGEAGRVRTPQRALRSEASVKLARNHAVEAWGRVAQALDSSRDGQDRELANAVLGYVAEHFGKAVADRLEKERSAVRPQRRGDIERPLDRKDPDRGR